MRFWPQKRASTRIRGTGWVFLLIFGLVLLAASNTGTNLLYVIMGGVASFLILSAVLVRWTLRRLKLRRWAPHAVERGVPFVVETCVENHKRVFPALSLRLERAGERGVQAGYVLSVPARGAAWLNVAQTLARRGVHRVPPFEVVTSFPFGLLERRVVLGDAVEVIVYPRVTPVRVSVVEQIPGAVGAATASSSDGDEYFALREYIPGDDVRHIVWRVSARLGVWIVRELARQHSRYVVLILDTRRVADMPDYEDRFEDAVDLAASLGVMLLKRLYQVAVVTAGATLESGEGTSQERRLLEMLARVQPDRNGDTEFDARLKHLELQPARLICISPDPRQWGERGGSGLVRVLDPREVIYA